MMKKMLKQAKHQKKRIFTIHQTCCNNQYNVKKIQFNERNNRYIEFEPDQQKKRSNVNHIASSMFQNTTTTKKSDIYRIHSLMFLYNK